MIIFVSFSLDGKNGLDIASKNLLSSIYKNYKELTVITTRKIKLSTEDDLNQLKWIIIPKLLLNNSKIELINIIKKYLIKILMIFQGLNSHKPELIFVNELLGHSLIGKINIYLKGEKILLLNSSPNFFQPPHPWCLKKAINIIGSYKNLISVSKNSLNSWLDLINNKERKTFIIHNCCNEEQTVKLLQLNKNALYKKLCLNKEKYNIICVASIQPRKNQNFLIECMPEMLEINPNIKLHFIGHTAAFSQDWSSSLFDTIRNDFRVDQIEYLGVKDNILEYIYCSDLLILPSLSEALPVTILEAMALKTPVIASNVDGITELIEHKTDGLLFNPYNKEEFIQLFKYLVKNPENMKIYAQNAYKKYWLHFSKQNQIQQCSEYINSIIH